MNVMNIIRLAFACLLPVWLSACSSPQPVPNDAKEERQRYESALREERQRHDAALKEEQRRHERALRDCQKRADELQKKLDGLVAIEREMRLRDQR